MVSERRACRVVRQWRGTQRYQPLRRTDEDELTQAILALGVKYGRYGYRRITVLRHLSIKLCLSDSSGRLEAGLEHGVVTIPAAAFGSESKGFLRISFCADEDKLSEGVRRLGQALKSLR